MFKIWLPYYIFGNLNNPDEFYLDHEETYDQTTLDPCDEHYISIDDGEIKDLITWELDEDIIDGLYEIVDQNLYKLGYELI